MFLRGCKRHKPCGETLKGAHISPGRAPVPFQAGWVFMVFLMDWWHLRISCVQICSASTKERLRTGPGWAAGICRRAGSFLVGLGKLNLACWAWQNRDWGELQSQHCGCGAGSSNKLTRNKFRLEIKEVCHMTRSSSFLGLWPLSFLWEKLSLIGLGGFISLWGLGLQLLLVFLSPRSSARGHVPQD